MKNRITQVNASLVLFAAIIILINCPVSGQESIALSDGNCCTKDTYTYKVVDNCKIQADVYRYPGEEMQPAIIWIHGGALIMANRNTLSLEQMEKYIKAGYTVVSIDYRLAPETKLQAIIEDLEDAYAWVRTKGPNLFNIDPDRIAIVGHSAGGYLTLMAGVRLVPHPKALVSFYGYGDITGSWYTRPDTFYNRRPTVSLEQASEAVGDSVISGAPKRERFKFYLYCRQQGIWPKEVSGHDPQKEHAWFSGYEPIRNITPTYPPTLLIHGEKDTDVPFEQSVLMAEALKSQNVEYELITNQDWGHNFDRRSWEDKAVQEAFRRVLSFLEKHLR
jgi:acetyl esterase/lipase